MNTRLRVLMQHTATHLCLLVLLAAAQLAAAEEPDTQVARITRQLEAGEPLVFATFGDSITYPCYHTDYRQNYITFTVDALRRRYPKSRIEVVHAGNMGTAERGLRDGRFEKHVLAHKPDVVFIMFGMNDCLGGPAALEAYDGNLTKLIRQTREAGAIPIIVTQNEIIHDGPEGQQRRALPQYRARALRVANRESVPAVDCFAAWKPLASDPPRLAARLNDWIHPNHAGHRLMARTILNTLWPEAATHVNINERTPARPGEADAVDCLLPGPPGKQILRSNDGRLYCLSGRRRDGRPTDLVLSFSHKQRPRWADFRHIAVVGAGNDAVFDAMDRTLTSGMLLEGNGKLCVVFSWNVGVFMLSLKPTDAEPNETLPNQTSRSIAEDRAADRWKARLSRPQSWLGDQTGPFVRPVIVANSIYGVDDAMLFDAYLQPDGWPAVLCSGRQLDIGKGFEDTRGADGIIWVTRPNRDRDEVRQLLHPGSRLARCLVATNGAVYFASQCGPGEALHLGLLPPHGSVATQQGMARYFLPPGGTSGAAVAEASHAQQGRGGKLRQWTKLTWDSALRMTTQEVAVPPSASADAIPLPWCDGNRNGIAWWEPAAGSINKSAFSYEGRPRDGAGRMGVLAETKDGLCLSHVALQ